MNLQTAIAEENQKAESRRRQQGRLRSVAESNVVHLPPTPNQHFESKFPNVAEKYGAPVREEIDNHDRISVAGINEGFFAAALGEEGQPERPTVRSLIEGRFYQYDPNEGIFKPISDAALASQISDVYLEGARATGAGNVNTDNLEYKFREHKNVQGIVNTAKGLLEVSPDYFRGNPRECIAVNNGALRLGDLTLLDHSPRHRFRSKLAVSFDPSAQCPTYLDFMRSALNDEDIETYQKWCGQALTGENIAQKIILLVGNAGTGKTTAIKILQGVIGPENFVMLRTSLLTERFELSRFWAKTILYAPDVAGDFLNHKGAAVLKSLSGHDPMTIEFKNSNEVPEMVGNKNVIITCNSRLVVRLDGDVEAWRRRLGIIPYNKPKPDNPIADLDQLILEREGPGVLNWMLEGLAKLRADDWQLRLTSSQQMAVDNLLLESDAHSLFVREELEKADGSQITVQELFTAYAEFCNSRGWSALGRNKFGAVIGDIVIRQFGKTISHDISDATNSKAQRGWRGLELRNHS